MQGKGLPIGVVSSTYHPSYNDTKAIYINEAGLYTLILGSRKQEAKLFKRWVTHDVLPQMRRQGFYGDVQSAKQSVALLSSAVGNLSLVLRERDNVLALALKSRDEALLPALQKHSTEQLEAARASVLEVLGGKLFEFKLALVGHISAAVEAAVRSGLALKRAQPKKRTANAAAMPEAQRATPVQTGPLSLGLSTVALELWPELPFAVWRKLRGGFGYHAKQERLRLHALGEGHAEFVEKPLLWAYTGATVEGGGARYVYLQEQRALLRRVFTRQRPTSKAQRAAGAPSPTESLEQRAHRLAARLSAEERAAPWPIHAAELEPQWDECVAEESYRPSEN